MADDVLLNKAATIERSVARAGEEYQTRQLPINIAVITKHLEELLTYSASLLRKDNANDA